MNVLGLDIGGANVKVSDEDGNVRVVRFPMWSRHQELPVLLEELGRTSRPQLIGLTMTAELADCFENKSAGVHFLVDSVRRTFPNAEVRVWLTSGEFAEPDDVIDFENHFDDLRG